MHRTRNRGFAAAWFVASLALTHAGVAQNLPAGVSTTVPVSTEEVEGSATIVNGRIPVFVEFSGQSAGAYYKAQKTSVARTLSVLLRDPSKAQSSAEKLAAKNAFAVASKLAAEQKPLIAALTQQHGARVLYNTRFATNGVAVLVAPEQIAKIRTLSGVKRVSILRSQEPDAASSVDFTGVRTFWGTVAPDLGLRGEEIGVGVIDTGIDHIHTNFGGPGGASYATGATTITPYPADPVATPPTTASFPTPKVIWGFDFAGDAYNAAGTTDAALIPTPDLNPMDTNGHGSAVASLIAGYGVNTDGTTYTGAYDRTSPDIANTQRISSGYAPEAKLYAFRVFGTTGSTDLTSAALDSATAIYIWQANPSVAWDGTITTSVENAAGVPTLITYTLPQPPTAPRLRVVNLSLGSPAGDIEESSAIAAQAAADAGLVVVLSAGNNDDTFYITGSPGVASGGISVAASINDQFPGGSASAPAYGSLAALTNAPIVNLGTASFSTAPVAFAATDAVYAFPNLAEYTAAAPSGVTVAEAAVLVTLKDPSGVPINLFSNDGSGNLVVSLNPAATNPYAGKVVLVDRGSVGFHQKALAVERAGGLAAIIVSSSSAALTGMAANANLPTLSIPSVLIEQSVGAQYNTTGALNTGVSRTVSARPNLQLTFQAASPNLSDTIAAYSSRGPRRSDSAVKPDITAPAENVTVALATSGNQVTSFNGTSSAAPHTAGAMTLLRQLHPTWSNYELKALLMNSVANDIYSNPVQVGPLHGVTRQGVGRWTLAPFSGGGNSVLLFAQDLPDTDAGVSRLGAVSVSFGFLDIISPSTFDRTVIARNKSAVEQTFTLGFTTMGTTPGVSYSFPGGNTLTVPANSDVSFTVRLTANPSVMRHARDAALRPWQYITNTNATSRRPRQFPNEASGYITLTPAGGSSPTHRLTVQAFPRRAAAFNVDANAINLGTTQTLPFSGVAYNTGSTLAFVDTSTFSTTPNPVDIVSLAKGFELQYSKAASEATVIGREKSAEIRYIGVTSDFPTRTNPFDPATSSNTSAVLLFGIATFAEFETVENGYGVEFVIEIDRNRDGTAETALRQFGFSNGERTTSRSNIVLPVMAPAPTFSSGTSTGYALNVYTNIYTNSYGNNVVIIPVPVSGTAGSLGLTAATARFNYRVTSLYHGIVVSETDWITYDVSRPGLTFGLSEPTLLVPVSTAGVLSSFNVTSNAANFAKNGSQGLLMLYPMNAFAGRTQVIPAAAAAKLAVSSFSPSTGPVGSTLTVTGSGFTGATAVSIGGVSAVFTVLSDTQISLTVPLGAVAGTVRVTTPAGTAVSRARFGVTL